MSQVLDTLKQFAPCLLLNRLARSPEPLSAPVSETFPAAVMFADISGFTSLTETLTQDGPEGVHELTNILDIYIGKLIEIITRISEMNK